MNRSLALPLIFSFTSLVSTVAHSSSAMNDIAKLYGYCESIRQQFRIISEASWSENKTSIVPMVLFKTQYGTWAKLLHDWTNFDKKNFSEEVSVGGQIAHERIQSEWDIVGRERYIPNTFFINELDGCFVSMSEFVMNNLTKIDLKTAEESLKTSRFIRRTRN